MKSLVDTEFMHIGLNGVQFITDWSKTVSYILLLDFRNNNSGPNYTGSCTKEKGGSFGK